MSAVNSTAPQRPPVIDRKRVAFTGAVSCPPPTLRGEPMIRGHEHFLLSQTEQRSTHSIGTFTVACALCASAIASGGCDRNAPTAAGPPPPEVDVAKPIVRDVTEWDEFTGRLSAIDTVEVRPRVSGYLESVHFREGQIVKKGDLLFVIDPRPFRAVTAAAEAGVAAAQTRLDLARNDMQRSENLVRTGAVSTEDYDRRKIGRAHV